MCIRKEKVTYVICMTDFIKQIRRSSEVAVWICHNLNCNYKLAELACFEICVTSQKNILLVTTNVLRDLIRFTAVTRYQRFFCVGIMSAKPEGNPTLGERQINLNDSEKKRIQQLGINAVAFQGGGAKCVAYLGAAEVYFYLS